MYQCNNTGEMQLLEFSQRYDSFDFIIKSVYYGKKIQRHCNNWHFYRCLRLL